MNPDGPSKWVHQQQRLRETFLDLANTFVQLRMTYLRMTGGQPPDPSAPPMRKRRPRRPPYDRRQNIR